MIFKRIKTLWKLSTLPEVQNADTVYVVKDEKITPIQTEELGDGKAEYLGEGSVEEFEESEKERKGLKGVFGIGK